MPLCFFTEALQYSLVGKRQFIICVVTLLITLPLSLYRNIARLSKVGNIPFIVSVQLYTIYVTMTTVICIILLTTKLSK